MNNEQLSKGMETEKWYFFVVVTVAEFFPGARQLCAYFTTIFTFSFLQRPLLLSHFVLIRSRLVPQSHLSLVLYTWPGPEGLKEWNRCGWSHTTFLAIPAILQASDGTHTSVKLSDTKAFRHDVCSPIRTVKRLRNYGQAGLGIRANKAWLCHSTSFMSLDLWVNVSWFLFSSHRERRFYARAMHSPNLVHTFTKEKTI